MQRADRFDGTQRDAMIYLCTLCLDHFVLVELFGRMIKMGVYGRKPCRGAGGLLAESLSKWCRRSALQFGPARTRVVGHRGGAPGWPSAGGLGRAAVASLCQTYQSEALTLPLYFILSIFYCVFFELSFLFFLAFFDGLSVCEGGFPFLVIGGIMSEIDTPGCPRGAGARWHLPRCDWPRGGRGVVWKALKGLARDLPLVRFVK